jgi:hypothetical protein
MYKDEAGPVLNYYRTLIFDEDDYAVIAAAATNADATAAQNSLMTTT